MVVPRGPECVLLDYLDLSALRLCAGFWCHRLYRSFPKSLVLGIVTQGIFTYFITAVRLIPCLWTWERAHRA